MGFEPSSASGVFSSIEDVVRDAAEGKVFILLDDEDRENEGDFVVLADRVTPEAVSMMVRHGSGIVCLALSQQLADRLQLELAPRRYVAAGSTAFTSSIDARYGITTGVSVQDRVKTILTAVSPGSKPDDLSTPGHVFPVIAHPGGVTERAGHTEAGVAVAKLAGAEHAAVICEMINADGTMSRLPEIMKFAAEHGVRVSTIKQLIGYLGGT
ncbi:3,4-dihydroxy-2-butanone 4-phosphate synthase [Anaplasma platys]|uniref:3,4-dihydroxy-2-butanone 4-phosphate synthase n=1 Tax=Anaplasma platys TaxID=949 RepID=A0A858PZF8_9RICK|nr:3,4-dihydroxy-2-butanone-4-phosphate synthase [Anaplasma platys]QJC27944.1 3,4-dihydroxy-2-butanone 4-phosphate synthase [Anaplasma platys]